MSSLPAPARRLALLATAAAAASAASAAIATAHTGTGDPRPAPHARAARAVNVDDLAKLHVVGGNDNTLVEEGRVSGSLPGSARVTLDIGPTTATSNFTFYVSGGSMSGHGSAKIHQGSQYESFGGSASIRAGTGRYAHISGSGGFYGVLDRRNDDAEVQVIGKLHT